MVKVGPPIQSSTNTIQHNFSYSLMALTLLHYQCCLQTEYQFKKLISDTEKEAKAPAFDSSQQQVGSVYGAQHSGFGVTDASHSYYQVDFLAFHSSNVFLF